MLSPARNAIQQTRGRMGPGRALIHQLPQDIEDMRAWIVIMRAQPPVRHPTQFRWQIERFGKIEPNR